MALIRLENLSKIYSTNDVIAVGIRGVRLAFEAGEFVAITGKSGCGKTSLLNMIGGIDSYEEGELYIEEKPTSHYSQSEWEDYRRDYISYIFQDYNIVESFTVQENVELALLHIEDEKIRRERANELIERVGMTAHKRHKGSKLSGGQKQRTVIARALAKDSPIILADEPTGNLDSKSSAEIMKLLAEISEEKLVIVVTHNYEQVAPYATRHVRIFDGKVESDEQIKPYQKAEKIKKSVSSVQSVKSAFKNGVILGRKRFSATPKLSAFLSFVMLIAALCVFLLTSYMQLGNTKSYVYPYTEGRVIVSKTDGSLFDYASLSALSDAMGADLDVFCDDLLNTRYYIKIPVKNEQKTVSIVPDVRMQKTPSVGCEPVAIDEVQLHLPIYLKQDMWEGYSVEDYLLGKTLAQIDSGSTNLPRANAKIVGISYFYDNTESARLLLSKQAYEHIFFTEILSNGGSDKIAGYTINNSSKAIYSDTDGQADMSFNLKMDTSLSDGQIKIAPLFSNINDCLPDALSTVITVKKYRLASDSMYVPTEERICALELDLSGYEIIQAEKGGSSEEGRSIWVSESVYCEFMSRFFTETFLASKATLYFASDREVSQKIWQFYEEGYTALPSYTAYDNFNTSDLATKIIEFTVWGAGVLFCILFLHLCTFRSVGAMRNDMGIFRTMGISDKSIRVSVYIYLMLALSVAIFMMAAVAVVIYSVPVLNGMFTYMHWGGYALLLIGLLAVTLREAKWFVKRLYSQNVKKNLRGGKNA